MTKLNRLGMTLPKSTEKRSRILHYEQMHLANVETTRASGCDRMRGTSESGHWGEVSGDDTRLPHNEVSYFSCL